MTGAVANGGEETQKPVDIRYFPVLLKSGFAPPYCTLYTITMAEDKRQLFKTLGFMSSVGISMVASTFIGLAMGYYLDRWLDTSPWCTLIFLGFGIVSGFRNIYILTERELRRQQDENHKDEDGE